MKKPASCAGCAFYQDGQGFVPDELRDGAAVLIVGQNPGAEEVEQGRPFVGKTGQMMESKYLKDAGLTREDVSIGNAIRCRWRGTNELPKINETLIRSALAHCHAAHFRLPADIRLIIAQGDYAAMQLTGGTVGEWRGYVRPYVGINHGAITEPWVPQRDSLPVLDTVHLARLFREPSLTLPTRLDWAKVPRILAGKWPRKPPRFNLEAPQEWPEVFAFDTEYWHEEGTAPTSARLTRWSASWGTGDGETCVVETGHGTPGYGYIRTPPRVITQYAPADVHHLARLTGTTWHEGRTRNHVRALPSMGGDFSPWNRSDMASMPALRGAESHASPTEPLLDATSVWNRFLIEDTVWKHAVLWSDHSHDLNYLGSLYSSFNRWKHLSESDPILYSGLDALGLLEVDRALERELDADPQSRRVWESIDRPALGEFVRAQYRGLRTDPSRVNEVVSQLTAETIDAQRKAQAICGWPVNLASNPQVGHRLYDIEGLKPKRSL